MTEGKVLVRAEEVAKGESRFSHPWNPNSKLYGTHLSTLAGLSRVGVSRVRVPPRKESFVYHSHYREEEWIFVISGRGVAEIDGEEFEVGAGDFMGFPAPQVAHHMRNPGTENLVYLVGGENLDLDIADFPRLGKHMVCRGQDVELYDIADAKRLGPLDV